MGSSFVVGKGEVPGVAGSVMILAFPNSLVFLQRDVQGDLSCLEDLGWGGQVLDEEFGVRVKGVWWLVCAQKDGIGGWFNGQWAKLAVQGLLHEG